MKEKQGENNIDWCFSYPIKFTISRIQFVFAGFGDNKKEGSIINPFLFEDFKLGRYILINFESGVDKVCCINLYCLNAMFWMCWHVDDCLNTLCLHLSLIWNLPNMVARLWCSSGLVNTCFLVSECYLVIVKGLERYFERLLLANRIWCIFMIICCFFVSLLIQVYFVLIICLIRAKKTCLRG